MRSPRGSDATVDKSTSGGALAVLLSASACLRRAASARCTRSSRPGRGTVLIPVAISVGSILLVQLPAANFLSARYGLDGVWLAYPVVFVTMLLLQSAFYRLVWRHKTIERLV